MATNPSELRLIRTSTALTACSSSMQCRFDPIIHHPTTARAPGQFLFSPSHATTATPTIRAHQCIPTSSRGQIDLWPRHPHSRGHWVFANLVRRGLNHENPSTRDLSLWPSISSSALNPMCAPQPDPTPLATGTDISNSVWPDKTITTSGRQVPTASYPAIITNPDPCAAHHPRLQQSRISLCQISTEAERLSTHRSTATGPSTGRFKRRNGPSQPQVDNEVDEGYSEAKSPTTFDQAMSSANARLWAEPMDAEFTNHMNHNTLETVPCPPGACVLKGKWVSKEKTGQRRNRQTEGVLGCHGQPPSIPHRSRYGVRLGNSPDGR